MTPRTSWIWAVGIVAAVAVPAAGAAMSRTSAPRPTLATVVVGSGHVTSTPPGISCPGRCSAIFAPGTRVRLTPSARSGHPFLRWGGSCSGRGACSVKVSALAGVAAQFAAGTPAPPTGVRTVAEPGTYSLYNTYRNFFVAPGGTSIMNVAIGGVAIVCAPAASSAPTQDTVLIARATIRANGSFVGKGSQQGLFAGFLATFSYTFSGRFTAATTSQAATAAGTYREDVVFKDDVTHHCTSNDQSWTAAKTGPVPLRTSLVRPGKYSLYNTYRTFSVAPGSHSLQNVAIGGVAIACTPAARGVPASDQIVIAQVPVQADGSFDGNATQSGVFAGAPATFTYTFNGQFQGQDRSGTTTVAGLLREDVVFRDAAGPHTCTSNTVVWNGAD